MKTAFTDLMRDQPCAYCGAQPGARCTSRSGRTVSMMHAARWHAAKRLLATQRPL